VPCRTPTQGRANGATGGVQHAARRRSIWQPNRRDGERQRGKLLAAGVQAVVACCGYGCGDSSASAGLHPAQAICSAADRPRQQQHRRRQTTPAHQARSICEAPARRRRLGRQHAGHPFMLCSCAVLAPRQGPAWQAIPAFCCGAAAAPRGWRLCHAFLPPPRCSAGALQPCFHAAPRALGSLWLSGPGSRGPCPSPRRAPPANGGAASRPSPARPGGGASGHWRARKQRPQLRERPFLPGWPWQRREYEKGSTQRARPWLGGQPAVSLLGVPVA
jgi:hypothetical protein